MKKSDLFVFAARCLAIDHQPAIREEVAARITSGTVDWEAFVSLTSSHLVLPAVYPAFLRHQLLPLLPADLQDYLEYIHSLNLERNRLILTHVREITRLFNSRDIEPVFLKGAGFLLQNLYPDSGDRILTDIDVLIPEDQIKTAAGLLYEKGYGHNPDHEAGDFDDHHHLPGFLLPGANAYIELHRSAVSMHYRRLLPAHILFSGLLPVEGLRAWVLSPQHQAMHLFIHNQLVNREFVFRNPRLKGMYDWFLLQQRYPGLQAGHALRGHRRRFNAFCRLTAQHMGAGHCPAYRNTLYSRWYVASVSYLHDHPGLYRYYYLLLYNFQRLLKIIRLVAAAPFDQHARSYIRRKIGSRAARKAYFAGLAGEWRGKAEAKAQA